MTAERVGTAEFRTNMAKYFRLAKSGRQVIILQHGRSAYLLTGIEEAAPRSVLGCLRDRTLYVAGAVVNAKETWAGGSLP